MRYVKNGVTINKVALILSIIFPGIGQIYKREYLKGIDLIIIQCMFIFFLFYPRSFLFPLGVVLVPTLWVLGVADACFESPWKRSGKRWRREASSKRLRRRGYSRLFTRLALLTVAVWVFTVIVFVSTTILVKRKANPSKPAGMIVNEVSELQLLPEDTPITNSDDMSLNANPANIPAIIPVKEQNPLPAELAPTSSDMLSTPTDTHPSNVESDLKQLPQINLPWLEERNLPYVITVGAFSQLRNADELCLRLSRKKYQSLIIPAISVNNQRIHVVVISGFASIPAAKVIADKLKREFRDCFVATLDNPTIPVGSLKSVPTSAEKPPPYVITTGAFSQYRNAERLRLQLSRKKYPALIVPAISSNNQKIHVVVISGFASIPAAKVIADKLKREFRDCFVATLDNPTIRADNSGR